MKPGVNYPPRLKGNVAENRAKALALLDEMDALCAQLQKTAPSLTSLDAERLEIVYLEPMRKTLEIARFCAEANFPEYGNGTPEDTNAIFERLAPELKAMDVWRKAQK